MECLLDVLFAQVSLAIVEQNAPTPEQEDCTVHESLLHVVRQLDHLAEVVWRVQNRRLNPHLDMPHRVLALFQKSVGVEDSFSIFFALNRVLHEALILDELVNKRHFVGHRCIAKFYRLLYAFSCLGQHALRQVASIRAQMGFSKLRIEIEGLFAVKKSLFVLALLDVSHSPIRKYPFTLAYLDCL